eukprot:UN29564
MKGSINLTKPEVEFFIIESYGSKQTHKKVKILEKVFFGRRVTEGARSIVKEFSLKKRKFIGPTSLDPELAFIMCNQAHIVRNSIVYDPFVGTGGLLIASAYLGAYNFGQDIDIRVLRGHTGVIRDGRNPLTNFEQYNLPKPDIIRGDNCYPNICNKPFIDVILSDPPYGIRAGARKTGSRTGN